MYGLLESILICSYVSSLITFLICGYLFQDVKIMPFVVLVWNYAFPTMDSLSGEDWSLHHIRKLNLVDTMSKRLQLMQIDLKPFDLLNELNVFLDYPRDVDTMQVSLEFLVLFSSAIHMPTDAAPDSLRLRRVLVRGAYAECYDVVLESHRELKQRHDVVVDLFAGNVQQQCHVSGIDPRTDRWHHEGSKIAWHLAIRHSIVGEIEHALWEHGLPVGAGCFSWSCNKGSEWAKAESEDLARIRAKAVRVRFKLHELDHAFGTICGDKVCGDRLDYIHPLLRAGANPEYIIHSTEKGMTRPFTRACHFGNLHTARLLLDIGVDPYVPGPSGKQPLERHDKWELHYKTLARHAEKPRLNDHGTADTRDGDSKRHSVRPKTIGHTNGSKVAPQGTHDDLTAALNDEYMRSVGGLSALPLLRWTDFGYSSNTAADVNAHDLLTPRKVRAI